ncbi:MAG: hypothetical protein Q8Q01_04110 [archaeon]|nr:hypothetical protein [archaeon]
MSHKKDVETMRDVVNEMQHHFVRIEVHLEKFTNVLSVIKRFRNSLELIDQTESSSIEHRYHQVGPHLTEQQRLEWKQKEKVRIIAEHNIKRNLILASILKNISENEEIIRKMTLRLRDIDEERKVLLEQVVLIGNNSRSHSLIGIEEIPNRTIIKDLLILKNYFNQISVYFKQVRNQLRVLKEKYTLNKPITLNRAYVQLSFQKIEEISKGNTKNPNSSIPEMLSLIKGPHGTIEMLRSYLNLLESDLKNEKLW